ncbi:MAG: extracellular solute-binding protein [Tenericutes bacterium]|nr:extracellular solute-binding protein [Mycoplasmatota bacterium]
MKITVKMKKYITLILILIVSSFIVLGLSGVFRSSQTPNPILTSLESVYLEGYYSEYLNIYEDKQIGTEQSYTIDAVDFVLPEGETLTEDLQSFEWIDNSSIFINVDIDIEGLYYIHVNFKSLSVSHIPIGLSIKLNGEEFAPYYEASQITLETLWTETSSEMGTDRYGNDVSVTQETYNIDQDTVIRDSRKLYKDGLAFFLEQGHNIIEIEKISGQLLLNEVRVESRKTYISYDQYISSYSEQNLNYIKRFEAEESLYKNSSTISRGINRDPLVEPYSMTKLKLNVLGTDSYDNAGDAVTWSADIDQSGWYYITFKASVGRQNTTSYRTLYINGELPFEEARHLPFSYDRKWQNITLKTVDHEPLRIYLEPGDEITLEVDGTLFSAVYEKLRIITNEMSELGLDVTKLTRNNTDKGIDWVMLDYFPDLNEKLAKWIEELNGVNDVLRDLYGFEGDAQVVRDIEAGISRIEKIQSDINELPRRLTLLSTGSSSAVQLITNQLDNILKQPAIIDAFFIHDSLEDLPNPNPGFLTNTWVFFARFFLSFVDPSYSEKARDDELEVWVNRSRQYVDMIQKISDDQFTLETGIKVKVSLINDDSKLLLANSANQQPDVALGISAWIPNEYGMRGMLYDMSQANGFSDTIQVFNPEQLIPMTYDDKLYGLPETENFFVLFYRRDILEQLDLTVPNTWQDVLNMLPVLRRYGMSFYIPLSSSSALKSFDSTAPFIYQFNGRIYSEDGLSSAIDNENTIQALSFMTDLYREYSMPFQVPSFFNSFRYGEIPIGIGDFGMYLQLMNAASDISGLWEIALVPGIEHEVYNEQTNSTETFINRSIGGAQQASIIFEKSEKKDEAWQYISWWMSTETQLLFSETMVNTLGTRYLWNSANLEAFEAFSWDPNHKEIILEQWTHLKEVPKIPGSYIIEREISNTWNSVVYNDANLRSTVSDALIKIDRELARKMMEFGYLDNSGNVVKPFILPTVENIMRWYND